MDVTQIILVTVISILTLLLVVIGLQFFLVLKEFRSSIRRANRIVDEIGLRTTAELLRVALGTAKEPTRRKTLPREKKVGRNIEGSFSPLVNDEISNGNGNGEQAEDKHLQIQLQAPRFFKGIPKRR